MRRLVIGDVHGCADTLKALIFDEIKIQNSDSLYFLGDYIDRGPKSKQVIDLLIDLSQKYSCTFLGGNHEEVAVMVYRKEVLRNKQHKWFRSSNPHLNNWLRMGGKEFLDSFGVDSILQVPESYIIWMENLKNVEPLDDYILVHAGLNFHIPNIFDDHHAMRWTRSFETDMQKTGNRPVVHGHVPVSLDLILQCASDTKCGFIPLDNGCVYQKRLGMGNLVALDLDTRQIYVQGNIDGVD